MCACYPGCGVECSCSCHRSPFDDATLTIRLRNPRRAIGALRDAAENNGSLILGTIADQIEAQTKPPKPAEPTGLGAVVEDAEGKRWTRVEPAANATSRNPWYPADCDEQPEEYADIDAVRVLSEGVPA